MEKGFTVSQAVVRRLPRYYRHVSGLLRSGVMRVSSKELAEQMGLTASQIRQDLNCFGGFGQQGYGYNVEKLKEELANILGITQMHTAIMLGVGNIGRALLMNFDFIGSGFNLTAAFDASSDVVGSRIGDYVVRDISELPQYMEEQRPEIAVLTLPGAQAREMASFLAKNGIRGLWNFTNEDLYREKLNIPVEDVHFSDSLMTLCFSISHE